MSELEELVATAVSLKKRLEKSIENGKKTAILKRTQGFLENKITDLKASWEEFRAADLALSKHMLTHSLSTAIEYVDEDEYSITETKYSEYMAELIEGLRKYSATNQTSVNTVSQPTATVLQTESLLPKIPLPKFDGNYDMWRSFRDIFTSLVHENARLTAVQKLHHLKACLSGEAEKLLRHTPITNEDYQPAWNKLKDRYENKRILVNHQLKILVNQPKANTENTKAIKCLIDTTEECLQQLKSLDVDTSSWDALLIYILVQKLPFITLKYWEEEQGATQELPTLDQFRKFLTTRLKILEAIADTITSKTSQFKPTKKDATCSYHIARENKCPICHKAHFIRQCPRYQNMDVAARQKAIKVANCCANCLSSKHSISECPSKYKCLKCNQGHHTTLHSDVTPQGYTNHNKSNTSKQPTPHTKYSNSTPGLHHHNTEHTPSSNHIHQTNYNTSPLQSEGMQPTQSNQTKSHFGNTNNNSETVAQVEPTHCSETGDVTQLFLAKENQQSLLSTSLIIAESETGKSQTLRVLIDTGSQSSFITEAACKRLAATLTPTSVAVTGLNTCPAGISRQQTKLYIRSKWSDTAAPIQENFLVLKEITGPLPTRPISQLTGQHLKNIQLADPTFWKPGRIDALLGAQVYAKIIKTGIKRGADSEPVAINTIFGWILIGSTMQCSERKVRTFTTTTEDYDINTQLKKFWDIEEIPAKPILTKEESECEQMFQLNHLRLENGRYQVSLPFINNEPPVLGQSRTLALKRFEALKRQFAKDPKFEADYRECLNHYIEVGHMTEIHSYDPEEPHYYIPHHAVFKDSSTTKLRVVFDASARTTNGKSINDYMLKGPVIQPKLFSTLLKWRKYKIAMNADIEKMYRMIDMVPEHRKFQQIVWQHPKTLTIQDYQLNTVTFGTSSAPYLAIRTLQQLARDEGKNWPLASEVMFTDFYVDDLLTGADTIEEAKQLQTELMSILKSGGFNLRKWASNNAKLLEDIPNEHRELKGTLTIAEDESIKTLGIQWHPESDEFTFKLAPKKIHTKITKRTILSDIASLYDPLGWLAPIIIVAKILMQTLWIIGQSWDNEVPETILENWNIFKDELQSLSVLKIPRWVEYTKGARIQLHGFCDASTKAYAAVLYLRIEDEKGVSSHLLTAKTRVAPTKPTTIPRLELNGAVLLVKLIKETLETMQLHEISIFAWTDSTIVLQWIKEHPSKWKTYVANRVVEIQDVLRYDRWRHVSSQHNPADIASRGISTKDLIQSRLWWNGPIWLTQEEDKWPNLRKIGETTNLEAKQTTTTSLVSKDEDNILSRYSSYTRLVRIIARIQIFIHNCRNPQNRYIEVSASRYREAETTILKMVQRTSFREDLQNLRNKKSLSNHSQLLKLTPFLDDVGLIRLGGRLDNAPIPYTQKHPVILPRSHHVTQILIDKTHIETLHGGPSLVLGTIRQKYWILDGRRTITTRIHKCITCVRHRGSPTTQLMGNLPLSRTAISKPFAKVGVDYAGPLIIKTSTLRNAKCQKAYFCIFLCMITRAIHIELVSDLTSEAFIAALRRFVARRGLCTDIYSDCGTNFIGGKAILDKEINQAIQESTKSAIKYLVPKAVKWHFNPPSSPHFGGSWEAGVKSIKHHLRRTLGNTICTFEELATILTQIEACLNSRPLCYVPNDPQDAFVLTPGHFLIGQALLTLPEPEQTSVKRPLSQRWKHLQHMYKLFWDKWSRDYLNQLQNRPKWERPQRNMEIGDVVLIKSDNVPPASWPLGVIQKVYPGADGLIRVVEVRTQHSSYKRPIHKLCRLPIAQQADEET